MMQECCVWQMKPMELIFILAVVFRFLLWQQVQTWHLYPCTRAVEALHSQAFSLQDRLYTQDIRNVIRNGMLLCGNKITDN